jgi:hypothetical protein
MVVAVGVKVRDAILVVDRGEYALLVLSAYLPSRRRRSLNGGRGIGGYRGRCATRDARAGFPQSGLLVEGFFGKLGLQEVDSRGFAWSRGMIFRVAVVVACVNRGRFSHCGFSH